MASTTIFMVQNQDFVWAILSFFAFLFFARFMVMLTTTLVSARKAFKITGKIK